MLFRLRPAIQRMSVLPIGQHPVAATAAALFVVALLLRLGVALIFPHPAYPDSFYYTAVARQFASGHGFTVPYLWSFVEVGSQVPAVGSLPLPGGAHWQPLASLVQVPFIWLLGPTDLASMLPFIVMAAALPAFTYLLVRDLAGPTTLPVLAGIFALLPGFATPFLSQPDNFALFGLLSGGALWLIGRAARSGAPLRAYALAGALAGLAYLSRTDGVLVSAAVLLWGASSILAARRQGGRATIRPRGLAVFAGSALLVVMPWIARQIATFGTISESATTGRILWIRSYQEMFSADGRLTPGYLFGWEPDKLLNSRLDAVSVMGLILGGAVMVGILVPFALVGMRRLWGMRAVRPFYVYTGMFLVWSALVAAPHLASGNFLHSAVAILPIIYASSGLGLMLLIARMTRRWPYWDTGRFVSRIGLGLVVGTSLGALAFCYTVPSNWHAYQDVHLQAVKALAADAPDGALVMTADPGSVWSLDPRYPGIQTPTSDLAVIGRALTSYHVRYLILEKEHIVSSLTPLLQGKAHPDWLADPILVVPDPAAAADDHTPLLEVWRIIEPAALAALPATS